jgi:nucleotide-binding universal stress UspA family protein
VYSRILVPLDRSAHDGVILEHVRPLARHCGATLVLLHVADGWVARNIGQYPMRESEEMREDRAYLERTCQSLAGEGFTAEALLACGDPAEEIVSAAERERCDLVAMASHGHRFLADMIHGSVANVVRHRSRVPVLFVRGLPGAAPGPASGGEPARA